MNRRIVTAALATLALPLVPGCFFFDDFFDDDYYDDDYYDTYPTEIPPAYNDGSLLVESSAQVGDMGDIRGYASDAVASQATYSPTYASVRLDSLGESWWVMSYLSFQNLDLMNAPAGTYRGSTDGYYDGSSVYISATGCSGPTYGNYTFDATSEDVEVTIVDNADGSRTLEFQASFRPYDGSAPTVAEGSFTYRQGETTTRPPSSGTFNLTATDASQEGDMGSVAGYSAPATASEGYYYGDSSSLRLDSLGEGWWVMSYVNVSNFDIANAPAGTYSTTSATYDGAAPYVSVTGCSGPSYGNYTFDAGSDEAEIVLTDNEDGSRTMQLTAAFGEQTARATFRFSVADVPL